FGRSQKGNNNAWCQDNELSWFRWAESEEDLTAFTKRLIALRRAHPVFRRQRFLTGREVLGSGLPDVWWFRPDGRRMTQRDWQRGDAHALGVFLNGLEIPTRAPDGSPIEDDSFLLLFNAHYEPVSFSLPTRRFGARWTADLGTAELPADGETFLARADVTVADRGMLVLRRG